MPPYTRGRRDLLLGMAAVVLSDPAKAEGVAVKWSSGTATPRVAAPKLATDCHHHIYDLRFPVAPQAVLRPGDATVDDYRALQRRIGIARHVIVQPSTYGTDNRCLLDALAQFGAEARGVAVVTPDVTDAELRGMQAAGVRGIRFNLAPAGTTTLAMIAPLSGRVAELGWHMQINMASAQILAAEELWRRLPCPVVFDHLAHLPEPAGPDDTAFAMVARLLQAGRAWVKLSGAYMDTRVGPPGYADRTRVAQAFVREAPERLVWGSDWPHPTEKTVKPDDAILFDLLAEWAPDVALRERILVDNPAQLYGF